MILENKSLEILTYSKKGSIIMDYMKNGKDTDYVLSIKSNAIIETACGGNRCNVIKLIIFTHNYA